MAVTPVLKNYRRKKFFYRLFLLGSPRGGAMFGTAWLMLCGLLVPFLMAEFLLMLLHFFGRSTLRTVLLSALPGTAGTILTVYGIAVLDRGLGRILRRSVKWEWLRELLAAAGALFMPLIGLVTAPELIRNRRYLFLLPAAGAPAVFVLGICGMIPPAAIFPAGTLLALGALAGVPGKKFDGRFLYPLAAAVLTGFALLMYDARLKNDLVLGRQRLSQAVGRSVEIPDLLARDAQGLPADAEPLKTLIGTHDEADAFLWNDGRETDDPLPRLREFEKRHARFAAALTSLSALPARPAAHGVPRSGLLADMLMPELAAFRTGARYFALKMRAFPADRRNASDCDRELILLRDRALKGPFLIPHLVARAIEGIRLAALADILVAGQYTPDEMAHLAGTPPDWDRNFRFALGDEAALFQSSLEYIMQFGEKGLVNAEILGPVKRFLPLFLHILFLRDYRFALQTYDKMVRAVGTDMSAAEIARLPFFDGREAGRKGYILSGMFIPSVSTAVTHLARTKDRRTMTLLAAEVTAYARRHGRLPDTLAFLPNVPRSELDRKPLMYAKTPSGFRIYSHTGEGRIPDEKDTLYTLSVKFPASAPK